MNSYRHRPVDLVSARDDREIEVDQTFFGQLIGQRAK